MKKLFISLLLTVINFTVFAQLKPYQPNPVLDKFVGTWVAKINNKTITITIKKIQVAVINTKEDLLVGYLVYKDNNQIIEESTIPVLTQGSNYSEGGKGFQDKVFFNYFDKAKQKRARLSITLSATNPNEFTSEVSGSENEDINIVTPSTPYKKRDMGYTLPFKLIFERQ